MVARQNFGASVGSCVFVASEAGYGLDSPELERVSASGKWFFAFREYKLPTQQVAIDMTRHVCGAAGFNADSIWTVEIDRSFAIKIADFPIDVAIKQNLLSD
jgi:hypothetical protein